MLVAVLGAVLLHAGVLWGMARLGITFEMADALEWRSRSFKVEQVEVIPESSAIEPAEEDVPVPPEDASTLLTEIEELLPELENLEIDVSPDIAEPEVAIQMEQPALAGDEAGELLEPVKAPEVSSRLEEVGKSEALFQEVPEGRVVIEEGTVQADIPDPDEFLKDAARKGAGGLSDEGLLEGYTGLGKLLTLPAGELNRSRAALPSDLLFSYDSAELKQSARLGLMKLAILIDRNPRMYCILEGHTDLFGTEEYNADLSRRRAEAVKYWLVKSLRLDGERIVVRGYGKTKPKVKEGSIDEQAINRRVDILMRKEIPDEEPVLVKPKRKPPVEKPPVRAVPVEEDPPAPAPDKPLRAKPVVPPRAVPVDEGE
ncbi:MAG: OmpA family protein [Akkermansiaceae bacterium]|nr:OmpA family protein [Akkermansiaceae bacterium]NNM28348.1 OmpA family protein [Akkermansiaceae bacterium]